MKQISFWASQHVFLTRFLIVIIFGLLNAVGLFFGLLLQTEGIRIPFILAYILIIPFLATVCLYPNRKEKIRYRNFYRARKTADLLLAGCTFFAITILCNQPQSLPVVHQPAIAMHPAPAAIKEQPTKKKISIALERQGFFERHWKKLKTHIKDLRTELRKTSKLGKALLIALTLLVAAGLMMLVAALSCELSCSGSEGLALAVLLLGSSLVTLLVVLVVRRIHRGPKVKKPEETGT